MLLCQRQDDRAFDIHHSTNKVSDPSKKAPGTVRIPRMQLEMARTANGTDEDLVVINVREATVLLKNWEGADKVA